jgi:hypothetical protein
MLSMAQLSTYEPQDSHFTRTIPRLHSPDKSEGIYLKMVVLTRRNSLHFTFSDKKVITMCLCRTGITHDGYLVLFFHTQKVFILSEMSDKEKPVLHKARMQDTPYSRPMSYPHTTRILHQQTTEPGQNS